MTEATTKKDPFDFLFFYEFDGEREEDALLVGGDDPSTASPLHLAMGIKDAGKIVISPIPEVTRVSSSNYHFKLQFTPGILLQPGQITVEGDDWGLEVEGDTILYLLWKGEEITLDDTNSLELMLNRVMGTLTKRASQTNVTLSWEFKRDGITIIDVTVRAPGDTNPYNNTATETLEMIQRQGKANIPLYVGFFSSNRVLNTNNQESNLKLRITNTSESPITFNYDADATNRSQLIVALEVGDAGTVPWALGTVDQVNDVEVSIAGGKWNISANPTEVKVGTTVRALEWTISPTSADVPLAPQETLVVDLSKIVTAHPTGTANLYLRYKYVPGYQDGEFICPIEKAPLVFPEKNVGIGTTTPKQTLHVAGDYYGKGHIWLYAIEGDGKSGTVYIQARDNTDSSDIGLVFRTQTGKDCANKMYIAPAGNVGIGNFSSNTEPNAKLHVKDGDAIFSGDVNISGNLNFGNRVGQMLNLYGDAHGMGVQGSTTYFRTNGYFAWFNGGSHDDRVVNPGGGIVQMKLDGSSNLEVNGRIKDKTGYVIPVGTVVPYAGSTAPQGWLLCNGESFNTTEYSELYEVLGRKNTVPDLRNKFIAGAGIQYSLGTTGGEDKHTLTIAEMPRHNHGNGEYKYLSRLGYNTTDSHGDNSSTEADLRNLAEIQSQGGGQAHENRPPFYALHYIIKA